MLKSFWHRRAYKKRLAKIVSTKTLSSSYRIQKVRVLLDASLGIEKQFFVDLSKAFSIPPVNISVFVFPSENAVESQHSDFFDPENIGFFGRFEDELAVMCAKDVDLQINYFDAPNLYMEWVAVVAKHKMSVGFSTIEHKINDLIFDFAPSDKKVFKEELVKYLKILNKI